MPVPVSILDHLWPHLTGFLAPAVERCRGLYALDDIRKFASTGAMQLWAVVRGERLEGCIVTELVNYPRARACWIAFAGGAGIQDTPEIMDSLATWAKSQGCAGIRSEGRRGWARAAGMEEMGAVLWRDLTKEEASS